MVLDRNIYLGAALKNPLLLVDGAGLVIKGVSVVEQSIINILNTPKGTKFFLPDFGSRLAELMFEPNDEVLSDLLRLFIFEALQDWEKRCNFVDVVITMNDAQADCEIFYQILASNQVNSFIYPFYRRLIY